MFYLGLGIEPKPLCMRGKHSANSYSPTSTLKS